MEMTGVLRLFLLLLGLALSSCQDQKAILILVVTTDDAVSGIKPAQLELTINVADGTETHSYGADKGKALSFPTTLTAEVYRSADMADVKLIARDKGGKALGSGHATAALAAGQSTLVSVVLGKPGAEPAAVDGMVMPDMGHRTD